MARKPRFNLPGVPQHVIQRGNNREPCFYNEKDYSAYLEFLQIAAKKYDCHIHAYVLMTNHVHLLITPMRDYGISALMQSLGKTNQDLVLGREDFKDKIEMMLKRKVRKGTPGRPCVQESEGVYYVY